jgi:hypothetical protein
MASESKEIEQLHAKQDAFYKKLKRILTPSRRQILQKLQKITRF